ncbi:hypothetical protein BE20_25035 [Sorangium cellulosum]|uniref:RNA polymerase sigma-70 region 2 domain-containing protein n=1 Tax=Sorangium cellulosum TaxID=56 RepID=A0A150S5Q5_SORCE|nr:hypothetical protein BE20_25035 [Sorangium cellulosum]KYF89253.1 hypothetical protein BE18_22735 [Sorangium cellulosum]
MVVPLHARSDMDHLHPAPGAQDRDSSVHRSAPAAKKGARRPQPAEYPAAYPSIQELLAYEPRLRQLLLRLGIPRQDTGDVLQDVIWGATQSIRAGRFRPRPGVDRERTLWCWLAGITWKVVGHYHEKAHRRREVPAADPWAFVPDPVFDPTDQLEAREALRGLERVPQRVRRVLHLLALGYGGSEIARKQRVPISTGFTRVRRGRQFLGQILVRGRTCRESPRG